MKQIWFKQIGWMYMPIHPAGFIITLLAIIFMVPVCLSIIGNSHSVTDDLYKIFVFGTCTAIWWKWTAEKTSDKQ